MSMERMYLDVKTDIEALSESGFLPSGKSLFDSPSLTAAMNDASGTVAEAIEREIARIEIRIAESFS